MRRRGTEGDMNRVIGLVNTCNTQMLNLNEQGIIRALFRHTSPESVGGRIESIEQISEEAHISQSSIGRFVRKMGIARSLILGRASRASLRPSTADG